MYRLQAVIAAEPVLRTLADGVEHVLLAPLDQGLALLPITDAVAGSGLLLGDWSMQGAVAYVEADYWGGAGTQSAQVWSGGHMVFGPLSSVEGEPFPPEGSPISQALRLLGAGKGDFYDEFDAVGLGRHRDTDRWLSAAD
ncbi:hypothetical protein [Catenulispora rubra]|uniref:hypothetical protein n=1 Tax=Catenulispora rubra TaxID=280293 RepID=UPI0018921939|nr:hypothetical protein [Catenulispora rubra]